MLTDKGVTAPVGGSLRAYARYRGCSVEAVRRAIKGQRLQESLGTASTGKPCIVDFKVADAEWAARTDLTKAPAYVKTRAEVSAAVTPPVTLPVTGDDEADAFVTLAEACRRRMVWQAEMAELEYRQAASEVVDKRELTERWADICTRVRTKLLGVAGKVKAKYPALTLDQVAAMDAGIREALEELADGSILHQ